jgi:hypothetical protein
MSNINLNSVINLIKKKVKEFQNSECLNFKDFIKSNWRPKLKLLEHAGTYVIYENGKVIYVGSAGKGRHFLKFRIADLFYKGEENQFKHTLTEKLLKKINRFKNIQEVRDFYLNSCSLKIIKTETVKEAKLLEEVLIYLLNPKYNK